MHLSGGGRSPRAGAQVRTRQRGLCDEDGRKRADDMLWRTLQTAQEAVAGGGGRGKRLKTGLRQIRAMDAGQMGGWVWQSLDDYDTDHFSNTGNVIQFQSRLHDAALSALLKHRSHLGILLKGRPCNRRSDLEPEPQPFPPGSAARL